MVIDMILSSMLAFATVNLNCRWGAWRMNRRSDGRFDPRAERFEVVSLPRARTKTYVRCLRAPAPSAARGPAEFDPLPSFAYCLVLDGHSYHSPWHIPQLALPSLQTSTDRPFLP
jgi:hypothetical protein